MKTFLHSIVGFLFVIFFLPLFCFGFVTGLIMRSMCMGYLDGYYYLELKAYNDVLSEPNNVLPEPNEQV